MLMSRVCEKYRYFKRNKDRDYFEFSIEDISKPHDKIKPEDEISDVHRGNDINHIKDKLLSSLVDEGLVEVISDEMYRLTEEGKKYCVRS
jgi:hypothetical protein